MALTRQHFTSPKMFCFQCEQAAPCGACTGTAGTCGKTAHVSGLQDELTGALIGLARTVHDEMVPESTAALVEEGLFATMTNVDFDDEDLRQLTERVLTERDAEADWEFATVYDMDRIWDADEDVRSLKSLVLFGIRGMAAYAFCARRLGYTDEEVDRLMVDALRDLGEDLGAADLLSLAIEIGRANYRCMELLDRANTESFGSPVPTRVPLLMERGPFVVVSGHDLADLRLLLEQTAGTGVSVYTHGEMLPAHAYPELKRFPQLKGHFGTAWQNQQREFAAIPGAVLMTSNCLMPPLPSYNDRVFTTNAVSYPGLPHIGCDRDSGVHKDFSPVIDCALDLGGYPRDVQFEGANGGTELACGFARDAFFAHADEIVEGLRSGEISVIYLVGGCDGTGPGRDRYAEIVKRAPADSLVLTLGCGKFRFNDLDLGTVAGLPRLMDMGQCNDAYSALQVALFLADVFDCGVGDLPLTIALSWHEQKAVSILLTLLYLGFKDIELGPTRPAFLSPSVTAYLGERFGITWADEAKEAEDIA